MVNFAKLRLVKKCFVFTFLRRIARVLGRVKRCVDKFIFCGQVKVLVLLYEEQLRVGDGVVSVTAQLSGGRIQFSCAA